MPARKSTKKRTYKSKFMDKKINTQIEVRMQQIAAKEVEKNRIMLINRDYFFGIYDRINNKFSDGVLIDFRGRVCEISNIPKLDVNYVINAPQVDDPDTQEVNEQIDGDGALQGMPTVSIQGRRASDQIKITGFSVSNRVMLSAIPSALNDAFGKVEIRWAIVGVQTDELTSPLVEPANTEIFPWRPFGYSAVLDIDFTNQSRLHKHRIFMKGSYHLRHTMDFTQEKFYQHYLKLKTPCFVDYLPTDQNGQMPQNWKFYYCVRSNIASGPTNDDLYTPRLFSCVKLHYYEP